MIYGPNAKGNFPRLAKLATKVPVFPEWHNKRSMLYIDNLAEFVLQAIMRELEGTFYPQNRELADTVDIYLTDLKYAEPDSAARFSRRSISRFICTAFGPLS
jgi:nucleoside-diphosphate-sugar epimerase